MQESKYNPKHTLLSAEACGNEAVVIPITLGIMSTLG